MDHDEADRDRVRREVLVELSRIAPEPDPRVTFALNDEQTRRLLWLLDNQECIAAIRRLFRSDEDVRRFEKRMKAWAFREQAWEGATRHAKTLSWVVATAAILTSFRSAVMDWLSGLASILNKITGGGS